MTKKKKGENSDLTRIEDLSEFLHQKDSDLDSRFDTFSSTDSDSLDLHDLDDQTDSPPDLPNLPDFPVSSLDNDEEKSLETSEDSTFDFSTETNESLDEEEEEASFDNTSFGDNPFSTNQEDSNSLDELEEVSLEVNLEEDNEEETEEIIEESTNDNFFEEDLAEITPVNPQSYTNTSERFEDVKIFAQNFSYGKAGPGGGNPPYTIIARNIRYKDDADNILDILSELGLINDQNKKDTEKAMEFGALIIPQISEYTAIILAHKLRRFDLDLQVGLSDEVHPSKSGMENPRGLLKKENLKQNKSESLKLSDLNISIKDIIISTTSAIPGYFVESYIGVQTTFTIVEESELEKLQHVARVKREQTELFDYKVSEVSTEKIFQDYQNSFELLYADLTMQLKQKAFTQHANALLGLTFLLSPLQFDRAHSRVNAYQITCSATLAIISRENS